VHLVGSERRADLPCQSSANLSKDYFSTRQDRYFHFRNSLHLTTYLANLLRLYTAYSYILLPTASAPHSAPSNLLSLISSKFRRGKTPEAQPWVLHWPNTTIDPRGFHEHAHATLSAFQQSWARRTRNWEGRRVDADTSVWPVLQAGVLGITEEERGMAAVWQAVEGLAEEQARGRHEEDTRERPLVDLTSGYFSLYGPYKKAVIKSKADVRIIAAAPKVSLCRDPVFSLNPSSNPRCALPPSLAVKWLPRVERHFGLDP
jgi:CDP-diacylglycerol--glycerol-3-phosphate 3-phosphatidyltransferase